MYTATRMKRQLANKLGWNKTWYLNYIFILNCLRSKQEYHEMRPHVKKNPAGGNECCFCYLMVEIIVKLEHMHDGHINESLWKGEGNEIKVKFGM